MPWLNQLVMMWSQAPEANSRSPSDDTMPREHVSFFRPARISAQIMPIGVRDIVLPPMPTESPSRTNEAASSSDTTFSRRLRSRCASLCRSSAYGWTALMVCPALPLRSLARERTADVGIELVDQPVPFRDGLHKAAPEALVPATIEILDADSLLLHPRVVPEIEDPRAVHMAKLEQVIVHDALHMAGEYLAGIHLIEPLRISPARVRLTLAAVHPGAIGGELDGRHDVGEPGDADIVELAHERGVERAAAGEIATADVGAEQLIERIARRVRDADHDIGVHDVVNQRDVLVADALN